MMVSESNHNEKENRNQQFNSINKSNKMMHVPFTDIDDFSFKSRQDLNFVASMSISFLFLLLK
jgi:hypothetical protein